MTKMPPDMAKEFELLQNELFNIHAKWHQFVVLYGDKENVEILNRTAPEFFRLVQDTFVDDVLLSLGRLLDPARSVGKDNLTIAHLLEHIPATGRPALLAAAQSDLDAIKLQAEGLKKLRNKLLAHNSLVEALREMTWSPQDVGLR